MSSLQRSYVTEFLKFQAEALSKLEGLLEETESEVARDELIKIQHAYVNLQNRFTRLVYLSGEITA